MSGAWSGRDTLREDAKEYEEREPVEALLRHMRWQEPKDRETSN